MDFSKIKLNAISLYYELRKNQIHPDIIILFGSHSKGDSTPSSDVDLAVVSRDFGKNRIKEGAKINKILYKIFPEAEAIPISLNEYLNSENVSPILNEIKKTGIVLL